MADTHTTESSRADDALRNVFFPPSTANLPLTTYRANCHCGHVKFTVGLPDIRRGLVVRCNCSICTKNGYLLVYPKNEDVKFISGYEDMGTYRFGSKVVPHRFCSKCGTSLLIDMSKTDSELRKSVTAVNLRTFVDVDGILSDLTYVDTDGKNQIKPAYTVPE